MKTVTLPKQLKDASEQELREEFERRRLSAENNDGRLTFGSSAQLDYDYDVMAEIEKELKARGSEAPANVGLQGQETPAAYICLQKQHPHENHTS